MGIAVAGAASLSFWWWCQPLIDHPEFYPQRTHRLTIGAGLFSVVCHLSVMVVHRTWPLGGTALPGHQAPDILYSLLLLAAVAWSAHSARAHSSAESNRMAHWLLFFWLWTAALPWTA